MIKDKKFNNYLLLFLLSFSMVFPMNIVRNSRTENIIYALSFDSVFRAFGQSLATWETIESIGNCENVSDLEGTTYETIAYWVYNENGAEGSKNTKMTIKCTSSTIAVAKEVLESFTEETWTAFVNAVAGYNEPANLGGVPSTGGSIDTSGITDFAVHVDLFSQSVSKGACNTKEYNQIKSFFSTYTGSSGIENYATAVFDSSKAQLKSTEFTEMITSMFYGAVMPVLRIVISAITLLFVINCLIDYWWMSSAFSRTLALSGDMGKRAFLIQIVSPTALKQTQCMRIGVGKNMRIESNAKMIGEADSGSYEITDVEYAPWIKKKLCEIGVLIFIFCLLATNMISNISIIAGKKFFDLFQAMMT